MHISFLKKKKNVEWNCDNGITEIGGKKNCPNWFVAMSLPKLRGGKCGNKFVAMALPKQRRDIKKKYAYSYSFSIFFLMKQFGLSYSFMVKVPYETNKDRFKYIDSYSKVNTVKKKKKYIDSYRRKK